MQNSLTGKENLLLEKADQSVMFTAKRERVVFVRGEGSYLWDASGKRYLDFISGWAVCCLGHSNPVIVDALRGQAKLLINPSPSFYNEPMIEFAHLLTKVSCMNKIFFASSGAEANEGAVKLARKYGQVFLNNAYEIITAWNSFHGRTLAMMAASGKKKWDNLFLPKTEGFIRVPFNDSAAVESKITEKTCAVLLEPIQGEGGVNVASKNYLKEIRRLCDEHKILLILDEVQTGIGRTGRFFAYEHYGIEPDVMTLAKGIGGGFPLSAVLAKDKACCFEEGDQGGTFCGTPLATAVGLAILKKIIEDDICQNVVKIGKYLETQLEELKRQFSFITDVRGQGLLYAIEFDCEISKEVVHRCFERFLLLNAVNTKSIRFMPALNISEKEVDEMIKTLSEVLDEH